VRHICVSCRSQMLEKGIRLETELCDAATLIPPIQPGSSRCFGICWQNAIKFTPENDTIRVTTALLAAGRWEVRVQDSGIGISVEALPRIFDAFKQGGVEVTRQFGGLGVSGWRFPNPCIRGSKTSRRPNCHDECASRAAG
jgi:light-regulated signal transduction histidine kinase (bacteriophytochrome)